MNPNAPSRFAALGNSRAARIHRYRRTGVAPGRRDDLGGLAEAQAEAGITAHLESLTRPVAVAGAGVDSPGGALLLGTRRVRPGAAVVVIAAGRSRRLLAAGTVAVVLVTVLARRRR